MSQVMVIWVATAISSFNRVQIVSRHPVNPWQAGVQS